VTSKWLGRPTLNHLQTFLDIVSILISHMIFAMAAFTLITGT
jgi:hypothetical protein